MNLHIRILGPALMMAVLALAAACGDDDVAEAPTPTPGENTGAVSPTPQPDRVRFMAGFKPQANLPFVGVYVAKEKGFFAEEGLDVDIQHSNPGENFRFLAAGEVQFSTADATALLEKWIGDPSLEIVSVALIGQTGQQGFAVLSDAGIGSPASWEGKTAGYKGGSVTPDYLAILEANGVERSSVREVKIGFEPQVLTEGQVDILPVFIANEPDTLRRMGFETTVFTAADYGAPTLGLAYVAMENYVEANPDIVRRFVRAALRGIEYADQNREEALDIVMQYASQEDREHQRYMLETELDMAKVNLAPGEPIGTQTLERWQALHDHLVQYGGLERPLDDVSRAFNDQFVGQ